MIWFMVNFHFFKLTIPKVFGVAVRYKERSAALSETGILYMKKKPSDEFGILNLS